MRNIGLFCEDSFHELYATALIEKISSDIDVAVAVRAYSATGGLSRMHHEFGDFLKDIDRGAVGLPDLILVLLDANCVGYTERKKLIDSVVKSKFPALANLVMVGIPDPHIERWMLVDPVAFRKVFGVGCTLPAIKCEKGHYKKLLRSEIAASGITAPLGGQEFASDLVAELSMGSIAKENSLRLLVNGLRQCFNQWKTNG